MLELTTITGNMMLTAENPMDYALALRCMASQVPMAIDSNGWVYVMCQGELQRLARYALWSWK